LPPSGRVRIATAIRQSTIHTAERAPCLQSSCARPAKNPTLSVLMNIATTTSRRLSVFVALVAFFFVANSAYAQAFHVEPTSGFLEFNAHAGGQATQTLHLQNLTSMPLILNAAISGSDSARFAMNSLALITLLDTVRKDVTITYSPTAVGNDSAMLTIIGSGDTQTVMLNGHAIATGDDRLQVTNEMNFSARVGESQCIPVTIGNLTLGAVSLSNFHITGGGNQFAISSADSGQLLVGGLDTLTICYTPISASGDAHATLSFDYTGLLDSLKARTIQLNGHVLDSAVASDSMFFRVTDKLEFEDVTVGTQTCKTVRISNPTATAVMIDSANVTGTGAAYYVVSGASNLTVNAGSTQYVTVCFMPTVSGEDLNGTLNLYYTSGSNTGTLYVALEGSTEMVDTSGTGLGSNHCLHVRRAIGVIGPIVQGGTASSTIYLTNSTGGNISITGATLSSGDSSAFSVGASQFPLNIAAGGQGQFNVSFNPLNANAMGQVRYTSRLTLAATGDSLNCGPLTIQVGGVAIPGNHRDTTHHSLTAGLQAGGNVDFNNTIGIISSGTPTIDTVTFYNTSNIPVTVNSIFMPATPNFQLVGSTVTAPTTIQPGGMLQAYIQFNPNGQINTVFTDQLFVSTNQSIQPQTYNVQGIQPAAASVAAAAPASLDFSIVPNPSSGDIRVILPNAAQAITVDVFDILGNHVAQLSSAQNYSWKGMDESGTSVAAGIYVVRVNGIDAAGHEIRGTRQVIIQK
jgi:hypothetical protein